MINFSNFEWVDFSTQGVECCSKYEYEKSFGHKKIISGLFMWIINYQLLNHGITLYTERERKRERKKKERDKHLKYVLGLQIMFK